MVRNERQPTQEHGAYSGKVFISGVGFLVAAAMWALLAYFRLRGDENSVVAIDAALSLLHLGVGAAILSRQRLAWYAGLILATAALVLTLIDGYFLPVVTDGVLTVLLYLSRGDLFSSQGSSSASRSSPR